MIKLGSNFIRLSDESTFHMKPTDIVTVASDGETTRITVYSENGFTKLEVATPPKTLSLRQVAEFYNEFAPNRMQLH